LAILWHATAKTIALVFADVRLPGSSTASIWRGA
jgi:hypothetical protein